MNKKGETEVVLIIFFVLIGLALAYFALFKGLPLIKKPTFDVATDVKFSEGADMDWAYAQNQREFNIDSTIYMRFIVDASASNKKGHNDPIKLVVIIPLVTEYTATLTRNNEEVDPKIDPVQQTSTYTFTVYAKYDEERPETIIFRFIPHDIGSIKVTYYYDDLVLPDDDGFETIYVLD